MWNLRDKLYFCYFFYSILLILILPSICLMFKNWDAIRFLFKKYVIRFFLVIPLYRWLEWILFAIFVVISIVYFKYHHAQLSFEIAFHFFLYVITNLCVIFIFFLVEFRQIYFKTYKILKSQHFVLRKFSIVLLTKAIDKEAPFSLPFGIRIIIDKLKTSEEVKISNEYFPEFLSASNQLLPSELHSVWNTSWYPVDQIIEALDGQFGISRDWKNYFDTLDKVYRNTSKKDNSRYFVVSDTFDFSTLDNKWKYLIRQNRLWGVQLYFINEGVFNELLSELEHERCRKWKDMVLFRTNILFCKPRWVVAETDHKEKFSFVDFSNKKEETKEIEEFFNKLKSSNKVYKSEFDENKIKISKINSDSQPTTITL